jgi:crotonobetaine/carnitine-CoA ligase
LAEQDATQKSVPSLDVGALLRQTIPNLFDERVARAAERRFLRFPGRDLTYGDVARESLIQATVLTGRHGLEPGDYVVTVMENGPELVVAAFATWLTGAILVPLDPRLLAEQVESIVSQVQPRVVLATGFRPTYAGHPVVAIDLTIHAADSPPPRRAPAKPRDPAVVIFTSGTTGRPKGVVLEHGTLILTSAALAARSWLGDANDRIYCPWSMSHSTGLRTILGTLHLGAECVIVERFQPDRFWRDVEMFSITCTTVLGMSRRIIRAIPDSVRRGGTSLRRVYATPSFPDSNEAFENLAVRVAEGYGLTETGQCLVNDDARARPGAIGRPTPYYEIVLQDDEGHVLQEPGAVGEICCRPRYPGVIFKEYLGDPKLGMDATRDLWFHTRDLARRDADGYYYLSGRKGETIRRSSEMISATTVEDVLAKHPLVDICAVVGVEDAERGEEALAFVSWTTNSGDAEAGELAPADDPGRVTKVADWLALRLPASWIPRYWVAMPLPDFPLTISGKVRKHQLLVLSQGRARVDLKAAPGASRFQLQEEIPK